MVTTVACLRLPVHVFLTLYLAASFGGALAAAEWKQIGPFGGDVRSLAADPRDFSRIFLGTSNGQIYASADGGRSWAWWSEVVPLQGYVVDVILVDPGERNVLYVGAWSLAASGGGGVFKSTDGGRSWRSLPALAGQSVRSLVQVRENPRLLVAGTLEGVFRTVDAGRSWERISPAHHEEIRNIESLALDPRDPQVIYAGTWHLPWKTSDGGRTWTSVKTGIIDDSDIFSIVVDWSRPKTVFASACSGIYRTDTEGASWKKIQGIPLTARRTRVLRQDPANPAVVYAGTTEGLWKTESGGDEWRRTTPPRLIVNDILIDSRNPSRVLLATDRLGVLESADAGQTFRPANSGFSHRQVSRATFDPASGRIYAAVLHDKEYGGVFAAEGTGWRQISNDERDVSALIFARGPGGGRLLAGLPDGLMAHNAENDNWSRIGRIVASKPVVSPARPRPTRVAPKTPVRNRVVLPVPVRGPEGAFTTAVHDFFQAAADQPLYAATGDGVLKSVDVGATWQRISGRFTTTSVAAQESFLVAGTPTGLDLTFNGGAHWFHIYLPVGRELPHTNALALAGKTIFAATDAGLFRSLDQGATWERKGRGVPLGPVSGVRIHPTNPAEVFVTARTTGFVYMSADGGKTFSTMERSGLVGEWMRGLDILPQNGTAGFRLIVASAFDGLFVRSLDTASLPISSSGSSPRTGSGSP